MSQTKINFFIITSQIGIINSEKVIAEYMKNDEINILIKDNLYNNYNFEIWKDVISIKNFISKSRLKTIKNFKYVINLLNNEYATYEKINFYVMDFDALSNHLANYFLKTDKMYLIEDGIVNYETYQKRKNFLKEFLKVISYNIFNIKTKFYLGSPTGIEHAAIQKQFVHYPKIANYPNKSLPIKTNLIEYEPSPNNHLILGQYTLITNESGYLKCLETLINKICSSYQNTGVHYKILYKPHRWEKWNLDILFNKYSRLYLVKDNSAIETIIHNYKPSDIYSFGSSALFNISLSASEQLRAKIRVYAYPYIDNKIYKNLIPIFQKAGVTILSE